MSVVVVKLGVGNTQSVLFALERCGANAVLSSDRREIGEAERLILPGVGAAGYAMDKIAALDLETTLGTFPRPILGICLGQQLFYRESEEGEAKGLGRIDARVAKLAPEHALPLPHLGWSKLDVLRAHPLLEGVRSGDYAYFAHSYACPLGPETVATARYAAPFSAVIALGNLFGCQFHPERSGPLGQRILANFLSLPC